MTSPDGEEITHYFYAVSKDTRGNVSDPSNVVNTTIDFEAPKSTFIIDITVNSE
jgi:hypothetical protein